ncbi:helix-turn-helix transcriptional regulator [Diaphorobacter sp. HDW4B]|uniref:helix-turn-helix transcriptional regulator n=1 Tax=Diaphorobacter sp. HDW4B TaxID=2714925 RepID=UPI00140BCD26|nr:helix-turn-helix transcriptional regulator [Diaphorobacter sp. HDW4B]QIL72089.1 helix-turn-helix transcriptional regulator [Diaphorobacter sp. HDW4B]
MLLKRRLPVDQWVAASDAIFEALGEAIVLVSANGHIAYASPLTRIRLGEVEGMCMLRHERLWHADLHVREQLNEALVKAQSQGVSSQLGVSTTLGPSTIWLHFAKAHPDMQSASDSLVYVRVRIVTPKEPRDAAEQLRSAFNITAAESNVLAALVEGCVAKQYATRTGVSIHTVRKQITTVMRKMDCTRQVELVAKARAALH